MFGSIPFFFKWTEIFLFFRSTNDANNKSLEGFLMGNFGIFYLRFSSQEQASSALLLLYALCTVSYAAAGKGRRTASISVRKTNLLFREGTEKICALKNNPFLSKTSLCLLGYCCFLLESPVGLVTLQTWNKEKSWRWKRWLQSVFSRTP